VAFQFILCEETCGDLYGILGEETILDFQVIVCGETLLCLEPIVLGHWCGVSRYCVCGDRL